MSVVVAENCCRSVVGRSLSHVVVDLRLRARRIRTWVECVWVVVWSSKVGEIYVRTFDCAG